jgi:pilus assembly protein CpaB
VGNRGGRSVLAAVLVGAVAAVAIWAYLRQLEDRAFEGARLTEVFVVTSDIRQGTLADEAIAEGRIAPDRIPSKFRPANAIRDLAAIRGHVASTHLLSGQIVSQAYFGARAGSPFAQQIPQGQVAISVEVDQVHGVANLVRPGDRVNILVVTGDGVKTLFQNVDVIAVGKATAYADGNGHQEPPAGEASGLVTFAVPLPAAQKIALAATTTPAGGLYLTLVPPENPTAPVPPLTAANLFQGPLTPYA